MPRLHSARRIAAQRAERLVARDEAQVAVEDREPEVERVEPRADQRGQRVGGPHGGQSFQNARDAIRAPSAMAAIFAHTTSGSTAACPTHVP